MKIIKLKSFLTLKSVQSINNCNFIFQYPSNVFSSVNYRLPKIFSEIKFEIEKFNRIFLNIQRFISNKEANYRDIPIRYLSIEEEMYIKNILKLNIDKVKSNSIVHTNLRIFLTDGDFAFKLLPYDTLDRDFGESYFISIFIGNKFYENENGYHLKLIIDIALNFIDKVLISNNIIKQYYYGYDYLIIKDFLHPSNIEFVFQYYRFLFIAIAANTNSTVNFDYVKQQYISFGFGLFPFSDESMKMIWELVEDELTSNSSDYDFRQTLITVHKNEIDE